MMDKIIIGIDPGANGGVCFMARERSDAFPMKSLAELKSELAKLKRKGRPLKAFLEEVGGYIGKAQPGSAMFKFGRSMGEIVGLLTGLEIPFKTVRPQVWQKGLPGLAKLKGVERKRALKEIATQRHPELAPTLKTCDAILIAEYGKNQER